MNIQIKRKTSINEVLKGLSKVVVAKGERYYFLPFWFKESGIFNLLATGLDDLPVELLEALNKERESIIQKQQQNDTTTTGSTPELNGGNIQEDTTEQG